MSPTTSQAAKIIFCFICTGMFLSADGDRLKLAKTQVSPQKQSVRLDRVASAISVRILARDFLGSGFIAQHSAGNYIVVTNQHVLRAGEAPYKIETVDGRTYAAEVVTDMTNTSYQYDLAILQFSAETSYQAATIGSSSNLDVGERVFAAGFPYQEFDSTQTPDLFRESQLDRRELALKHGRIAVILDRALEEGYQIGYTNDVKKGMSGGALLNERGEVIGVNGKHAYPLWESPEIYQDGSEPCGALQELITRSSLAIPIEKSIEITTQLKSLKPSSIPMEYSAESESPGDSTGDSPLATKMQEIAQSTKKKCSQQREPAILENQ